MVKMYFSPAAGAFRVGVPFTVDIFIEGAEPVNVVRADISYDPALLVVDTIGFTGSAFPDSAELTQGVGTIKMVRGIANGATPVTGKSLVGTIEFRGAAVGQTAIGFGTASKALMPPNATNVLGNRIGAAFSIGIQKIADLDTVLAKLDIAVDQLKAVLP